MGKVVLKRCARCRRTKHVRAFARKRATDWQPYCRECQNAYRKEHYRKNKQSYLASAKRRLNRIRAIIREAKCKPCQDCGVQYPYYVMDFDHRKGEKKLASVAQMIYWSEAAVRDEIAKCDVVCANCHRQRTHRK